MSNQKINELDEIRNYTGEVNKEITQNNSKNIIAYCRVSDVKQIGNNSTETQLNDAKRFAINNNLKIVKNFNVLGESSKQGSKRPSIDELFEFIKDTNHKIHAIAVFHSNRLTRDGAFGAQFIDKLIKKGIGFIDLNGINDIFTAEGRLRQINAFYGAEQDNVTRKKFINSTILNKLRQGYTMRKPPRGYRMVKIGRDKTKEQKVIINQEGKLLKQAFLLKLNYNYSNVKISEIMKSQGLDVSDKAIGKIFKNVYYCGLIKDKRLVELKGIIKGRHKAMITLEQYKIINNIGGIRKRIIKKKEHEELPLRKHLVCSGCHKNITGYKASKRSDLFYYKCRTTGCKVNKSNNAIHDLYINLLSGFCMNQKYLPQLNTELVNVFKNVNKDNQQIKKDITTKLNSITKERFSAIRNMNQNHEDRLLYKELIESLDDEANNLKEQLSQIKVGINEVEKSIDKAIHFINDLPNIWSKSDFNSKVRLQELVFPDGVSYNKKSNTLTPQRINPIFQFFKDYKEKILGVEVPGDEFNPVSKLQYLAKNIDESRTVKNEFKSTEIPVNMVVSDDVNHDYMMEKIPSVLLPTHRSNNFGTKIIASMEELMYLINTLINI